MQDLKLNEKEETKMKTTNKTIKRARLILMAVLVLGVLSIGVNPKTASTTANGPPIPVSSCGTVINQPGNYILTNNLNCVGTAVQIEGVASPGDSFDFNLNGFTISGDVTGTGIFVHVGGGQGTQDDYGRTNAFINGGTVMGFGTGIFINESHGVHLNNMSVTGNRISVRIWNSIFNHISDNTITNNGVGIESLRDSSSNHISGNTITNNGNGLRLGGDSFTSFNTISDNTVSNNGTGIALFYPSSDNTVSRNTALGNRFLDLSDPFPCGNRWRDNTFVTDSEGDGPGVGCIQ
jgi:parallel beta-helix repeat protein